MLLRNFPRLGGYTQRVRPGVHPVLDLQQQTFIMSTEGLHSVSQIRLGPPEIPILKLYRRVHPWWTGRNNNPTRGDLGLLGPHVGVLGLSPIYG